jgi:pimeloyl-ACP methyl ester carboxylesterase
VNSSTFRVAAARRPDSTPEDFEPAVWAVVTQLDRASGSRIPPMAATARLGPRRNKWPPPSFIKLDLVNIAPLVFMLSFSGRVAENEMLGKRASTTFREISCHSSDGQRRARRVNLLGRVLRGGHALSKPQPRATFHVSLLPVLLALLATGGCASPSVEFDEQAASLGLRRQVVAGKPFQHAIYAKDGAPGDRLHVYLGSDGTPWFAGLPAADPTPRNPLVLRLMALDPTPAVYLGRPCYHGLAGTAPCAPGWWTSERYGEFVVDSMAAALRPIIAERGHPRIAWFGHSGGGTLAVLLAERFPETVAVVTIAGNLDIDAWADLHGYDRLTGSLNPVSRPPLPANVRQRHYAGGRDRVVPADLIEEAAADRHAQVIVIDAYEHVCCWEDLWPEILADLDAATDD